MTFDEVLAQIVELLQREGRVTYRALKRRFALDDDYLEDVKGEIIKAKRLAVDEEGEVLVWVGASVASSSQLSAPRTLGPDAKSQTRDARPSSGERRQLTVMFIDLVGSTTLSQQLDPEDYHARVVAYQTACQQVIARYEGHIAQYLGDGVLVYFGYPTAHEEDAVRAVHSGLEIVTAVSQLAYTPPLQVRIGIHTGPVMVGAIGTGERTERLALGETPNIAARVQGQAEPDTVVISQATSRLVHGFFTCEALGPQSLKNVAAPIDLYRVHGEGEARTRFEVSVQKGLLPLVGREEELSVLQRRWAQAQADEGQVVLLSGEPGIGKSRLMQTLKEQASAEGATCIEFRCSPYHQNSAFYPLLDHLQRLLQFAPHEPAHAKLSKLQRALAVYHFPQEDTLTLLAALLSLPHPDGVPPLTLSPQKQKEKTQEVLVAWLVEEAQRAAVYCAWEDLHWADPSTLDVLTLFLDQVPTTRLLTVLTFRPEFLPPWRNRSHLSQLTLSRLGHSQVEVMIERVIGGKSLPPEVVQQIVAKTDGVPLFVEELTKTIVESGLLTAVNDHYELRGPLTPLAIPATLQDSLMARLDRLATVREIAQLGATLGREFSYELLHAVSPLDEERLQQGLKQLVEAELVYQRGLPPQAHYLFKHALIQDTAYQSLLKSTRQQYHRQIAQVLADRFPELVETQPELVAQHYTEAGLIAQALPHWQRAGEYASQRSAHAEAIAHLTRGLELLATLPDTPERAQQELSLQITLGAPLTATKGYAAPEVARTYARAQELCQQVGETRQLIRVLFGRWRLYLQRAELQTARELGEQLLSLARRIQNPALVMEALFALEMTLFMLGEFALARRHFEQGIALYDPRKRHSRAVLDPGVGGLSYTALALWPLGYPDQALKRSHEAIALAQELAHPFSLAVALDFAACLYQFRQEGPAARERAEALLALSSEQGFALWLAHGTVLRGWALVEQGRGEEGLAEIRQGLDAYRVTGSEMYRPYYLALLAEAYGKVGQVEEGLRVLAEALAMVDKIGGYFFYGAELYRLKGELTLQSQASFKQVPDKSQASQEKSEHPNTQHPTPSTQSEAEACFLKAIEIARKQQAKSWELRAVMSLSRLWHSRGKKDAARKMLAEIYSWFTEGFDTKDLQEAKALLEELH
jgi:class 3 adenylate cyclase/predicted ATPase